MKNKLYSLKLRIKQINQLLNRTDLLIRKVNVNLINKINKILIKCNQHLYNINSSPFLQFKININIYFTIKLVNLKHRIININNTI